MKIKTSNHSFLFASALFFLLAIPFSSLLFDSDSTLVVRDILRSFLPSKAVWLYGMKESFFPPQWNPYLVGGTPYWADLGQGSFHPLNLVFLLIPKINLAFSWFIYLHFPIAAWGMNLLLKEYKQTTAIRWIFSAAYCLGGVFFSLNNVPNILAAATLLPFFFTFWHRWRGDEKIFSLHSAFLSLCLAGNIIVGAPEFSYFLGLFLLITFPGLQKKYFVKLALLSLSALLFAALQLLPGILQLLNSRRGFSKLSLEEAQWLSFHPARLLEWILPLPFGNYSPVSDYWGSQFVNGPLKMPLIFSCYFGLALLWGVIPGLLLQTPRRKIIVSSFLLLVICLFSFGPNALVNINGFFFQNFPLWNIFRYPEKLLVFLHFFLILLSARGWEKMAAGEFSRWKFWGALFAAFIIAILILAHRALPEEALPARFIFQSVFPWLLLGFLSTWLFLERKKKSLGFFLLGLGLLAPLIWHDQKILWPQKMSQMQSAAPAKILADISKDATESQRGRAQRIASFTAGAESLMATSIPPAQLDVVGKISWAYYSNLSTSINSLHQLSHIGGHGMIESAEREQFWRNLSSVNPNRLLNLLGAYYILSPPSEPLGSPKIGVNPGALAFASAPNKIRFVSSFSSALEALRAPTFDEHSEALLESASSLKEFNTTNSAKISVNRLGMGKISVSVNALDAGPAWIQVNESFDPFWKAYDENGKALAIFRANGWALAFQAERPGEILLTYQNPLAWLGLALSFGYLFALILFRKKLH